jgi:hypothetical protein
MLMILAASRDMPERERDIVVRELIRGFNGLLPTQCIVLCNCLSVFLTTVALLNYVDLAREAGTKVTGGQTVVCTKTLTLTLTQQRLALSAERATSTN